VKPAVKKLEDHLRDGRFADPAKGERGERNSKLHGRQELINIVFELEYRASAGTAESDELLDAGLPHADQSELRGDKEAVGQNKEGHHDRAKEHPLQHLESVMGYGIFGVENSYQPQYKAVLLCFSEK